MKHLLDECPHFHSCDCSLEGGEKSDWGTRLSHQQHFHCKLTMDDFSISKDYCEDKITKCISINKHHN